MPYYAVVDTNVLVSAMLSKRIDSATVLILDRIFAKEIIVVYSQEVLAEYEEVLRRPKFKLDTQDVYEVIEAIIDNGLCIDPNKIDIELPDIKDIPFYEVVMEKRDDGTYLVTGNIKHFPKEPFIVTPREFLDIISEKSFKSPTTLPGIFSKNVTNQFSLVSI